MYIPNKDWDALNSLCCDLVEQLEAMPEDIFFACKKEAISLCHTIINAQDKPTINNWISSKILEIPFDKDLILASKEGIFIRANNFFLQIDGKPLPLCDTEFTHWMPVPSNPKVKAPINPATK